MNQNGNDKSTITCPHCGQRFSASAPTLEEPLNTLRSSIAVAPHEKPIRCPNAKCRKLSVWVVKEVQFAWGIIPITDEQAATLSDRLDLIIAPPPSLAIN